MRQAGIVAAGALFALDHPVARLADDHALARALGAGLAELDGVVIDTEPIETNIVVFEAPGAPALCSALKERGVLMMALGPTTVRAVTHLDVGPEVIDGALEALRDVLADD